MEIHFHTHLHPIQAGYAYVPYRSLESVVETNKEAYDLALRQTQGTGPASCTRLWRMKMMRSARWLRAH